LIDASAGSAGEAGAAGPRSLTTSNLVQINQAYSAAKAARVQAQQRWAQAQSTALMSLPEVLSNPTIQQLTQRRAEAEATYQEELQRRLPEHPAVKQAAANIEELNQQIAALATSIRSSLRNQYRVASRQEAALAGNVVQLKGETLAEQDRGVQYNILQREVETNRQLYDGLLQRFKEISAAAGITPNNVSVIDPAEAPTTPVSPRPALNTAAGGAAGLLLALLLAFLRERYDDSVRAPEDVREKLDMPLIGVIPLIKDGANPRAELENARSDLSEAHYSVRTSLELSAGGVPATLLLTSSRQSEGKSTTAYGIAKDFAASGLRVLLIDGDLRKPSLHRLLRAENELGFANVLARGCNPEEAIQSTTYDNLYFLPSGPLPPSPGALLATTYVQEVFAHLSASYDLVIVDGPPVLGLADAPRLASLTEGTIFVVEANAAHRGQAKAALRRLRDINARLIGVILTKFDAKKVGYGEDYGYSYSYSYRDNDEPKLLEAG
jgi:capsular exopolysaccharide synthesis family protein